MPRGGPRLRSLDHKLNQIGPRVRERRQVLALDQDEVCARLARETKGELRCPPFYVPLAV